MLLHLGDHTTGSRKFTALPITYLINRYKSFQCEPQCIAETRPDGVKVTQLFRSHATPPLTPLWPSSQEKIHELDSKGSNDRAKHDGSPLS